MNKQDEIRILDFPKNVQYRTSLYLSDAPMCFREIIDNSEDIITKTGIGSTIIASTNFAGGYSLVADDSVGIPIFMSPDRPSQTQADVSITTLHSGTNFNDGNKEAISRGINGLGSGCVQAVSEVYILMSKITPDNYDKSLPCVKTFYESLGSRSKKEIFYYVACSGGYKKEEGALKKADLEKKFFGGNELPSGMSTMVAFKISDKYFEGNTKTAIPLENIRNFLLIQEKFYKRKIRFYADGQVLDSSGFKPYQFEFMSRVIPGDTSMNKQLDFYVTFEADPGLATKDSFGSVNGLDCSGVHVSWLEAAYGQALIDEFKIKHKTILPGLKMFVLALVPEPVYDSQTKSRMKGIAKVKQTDLTPIIKDFQKVFRKSRDYWEKHVEKLNILAESYKSLGAIEKAQKIIDDASGRGLYKAKGEMIDGFSDATAGPGDRWNCSLMLVEGLSAGGSLKAARKSTKYFACLPLRGKVKNVKDSTADQMMDNKELFTLFRVIGLGIDANNVTSGCNSVEEAYEKIKKHSRYGKIILATDKTKVCV